MSSLLLNLSSLYDVQNSFGMWLTFELAYLSHVQTRDPPQDYIITDAQIIFLYQPLKTNGVKISDQKEYRMVSNYDLRK